MSSPPPTLIERIRASVIGADEMLDGPFGPRPLVYADYTASGRALTFIEDYLRDVVLPFYGNTHTESSGTGRQTTHLREEARRIVGRSLGATDEHAVIFCGSGSTAAIDKLVGVLGLRIPSALDATYHLSDHVPADRRPVVFIGPYEHHSNELPWRESIADVVAIGEDEDGHVSLDELRRAVVAHRDRPLLIGSFSAASNVTGILTDVTAVTTLLHEFGALACWDYAAAAPYVRIEMGSKAAGDGAYLDAIYVSPHKLIGGPSTPGVLVARREMFANPVPVVPGGGSVAYVGERAHDYLTDPEHREEAGTPAIVEAIRAGLVFQLRDAVGIDAIREHEEALARRAIASWSANPRIEVLGGSDAARLSIVSFVQRHGRALHHNFVVALLNDLFGIQARGGCSCAGPYGHRLLHIGADVSERFRQQVARGREGIKPGWTRLNFNYFVDEETFEYIVDAVHLVADEGWRLLPWYRFEPDTGRWRHCDDDRPPPATLAGIDYSRGEMRYSRPAAPTRRPLGEYLAEARRLVLAPPTAPCARPSTEDDFEALRWFAYADE